MKIRLHSPEMKKMKDYTMKKTIKKISVTSNASAVPATFFEKPPNAVDNLPR